MVAVSYDGMKPERLAEKLARLVENQSELARKTGVPQSAISAMISGKRRPYFDQMVAMARELRVPLEYLADDRLDAPPVAELTEDERYILRVYRNSKLTPDDAAARLIRAPAVEAPEPTFAESRAAKRRRGRRDGA